MASNNLYIFILLFLISLRIVKSDPDASDFIKAECRATRYPTLCIQCLSNYSSSIKQSRLHLAQVALSVSLSRAQSLAAFVSKLSRLKGVKPMEYQAVKDCAATMGDTIDQLSRSMKELGGMRRAAGQDFNWHVSNVLTWVSTALTNEDTCLNGFAGPSMDGNVKFAIRRRVVDCSQVTSNALALVNRFVERHKPKVNIP